jgi:hypothetical protein
MTAARFFGRPEHRQLFALVAQLGALADRSWPASASLRRLGGAQLAGDRLPQQLTGARSGEQLAASS